MKTEYLFVYGTLKRDYGNNRLLGDSKFLGRACSVPKFMMYAYGYPFLIECAKNWGGHQVIGELYEVTPDILKRCDQLEGHPNIYCREKHAFRLLDHSGRSFGAWVYIYQHPTRFASTAGQRARVKPNKEGFVEWEGYRENQAASR